MSYTDIDNSVLFMANNAFDIKTISVPASTTLEPGTLLGEIIASGELAQFKSGNTDGSEVPSYILAQTVENDTTTATTVSTVSVCAEGEVNNDKLIFDGTDTKDTIVADKGSVSTLLKNNGILIRSVQTITE